MPSISAKITHMKGGLIQHHSSSAKLEKQKWHYQIINKLVNIMLEGCEEVIKMVKTGQKQFTIHPPNLLARPLT